MNWRNIITLVCLLFFSLISAIGMSNDVAKKEFARANQLYTAAQYDSAVRVYEGILSQGYESAELYYNLGNAYYKAKNIPKAILNYERARLLKPNDDEINFNLQLAQTMVVDKINVLPEFFLKRWWRSFSYLFSSDVWAIISLSTFVLMLIGIAVYLFISSYALKKISFYFSVFLLLVSVVSFSHSLSLKKERTAHNTAIVMAPTVTVKSSPDENGTELFVIHEGTKVWIVDQVGEWLRIRIADGNNGWLKQSDIEKI
ncbi:MAG TPA: tetratricopeptide repeat protein [Bacteroidales bacterium]|nr:tetratricopeptide repeat protein [Bacteroidales bacterium]HPO64798.1 tetratricopeptide repeat protein [Bacteroidales bacterium]